MKKLVICIPSLRLGGAAKIALNLSEYYLEQGIEVNIILTDPLSDDQGFQNLPANLIIHRLPKIKLHHFIAPFVKVFQLRKLFNSLRPNGILAVRHDATSITALAWKLSGKHGRFVIRDINPITKTLKRNPLMVRMIQYAYQSADAVIANSNDVAKALMGLNWVPSSKIHVIDNPVITKKFKALANEDCLHPWVNKLQTPLIVTIGRLDKMKDQQTLIRAFAILIKTKDCRLMLIGEGPEAHNLQQLINSLHLQDHVLLAGPLENPYPILKRAEIFVLSSKYEGFGNVLVEALALGKKIIASNCSGGPAYILNRGQFGKLFPVGDHQMLAELMISSLGQEIDPLPLVGQAEKFSVSVISEAYAKLLF